MVTNEERDKWMGDSDEQRHNHHTRDSMGGSIRNAPDVMVRSLLNFKKNPERILTRSTMYGWERDYIKCKEEAAKGGIMMEQRFGCAPKIEQSRSWNNHVWKSHAVPMIPDQ